MTKTKIESWRKKYVFWKTPDGKASGEKDDRKLSWIDVGESKGMFTCFVCQKYKTVVNEKNAVTKGSTVWHVNVANRHERDDKHKLCVQKYISDLSPKT